MTAVTLPVSGYLGPYRPIQRDLIIDAALSDDYVHRGLRNDRDGYVLASLSPSGWVRVHREIAGALPGDGQIVHHITGRRHDNRRCNLQTIPSQSLHKRVDKAHAEWRAAPDRSPSPLPVSDQWAAWLPLSDRCWVYLGLHATRAEAVWLTDRAQAALTRLRERQATEAEVLATLNLRAKGDH